MYQVSTELLEQGGQYDSQASSHYEGVSHCLVQKGISTRVPWRPGVPPEVAKGSLRNKKFLILRNQCVVLL